MISLPTGQIYRRPTKRLSQGDIAISEVVQIRSLSGSERTGPGPQDDAAPDLPYLGAHQDLEMSLRRPDGGEERRVLRVWSGYTMVVTQNCEAQWANDRDSRITICPVVTRDLWPEGPWDFFSKAGPPGYLYLPPLDEHDAQELGLPHPWPESVVVLASPTVATERVLTSRRILSLKSTALPSLQDAIARFYGTRGFAELSALGAAVGKPIHSIVETDQIVHGPSRLIKVFCGDDSAGAEDELTVAYWGVRPS